MKNKDIRKAELNREQSGKMCLKISYARCAWLEKISFQKYKSGGRKEFYEAIEGEAAKERPLFYSSIQQALSPVKTVTKSVGRDRVMLDFVDALF